MANTILLNDVLQITALCVDGTTIQVGENIGYFQVTGLGGGAVTDQETAVFFSSAFEGLYKAALAVDVGFWGAGCRIMPNPVVFPTVWTNADAGPGVLTGITAPGQLTGLSSFQTNIGGPRGRGRKYWPFVPLSKVGTNNIIDVGQKVLYENIAAAWAGPLVVPSPVTGGTISIAPVIYHQDTNTSTKIISVRTSDGIASQRRRAYFGSKNLPPT